MTDIRCRRRSGKITATDVAGVFSPLGVPLCYVDIAARQKLLVADDITSAGLIMLTRMAYKVYTKTVLITDLKVYSNELFLFQLTNDLCTSFTKLIIILFLSKAVFIKKTLLFQYFVLKIEPP